jgi:hypothetical protein
MKQPSTSLRHSQPRPQPQYLMRQKTPSPPQRICCLVQRRILNPLRYPTTMNRKKTSTTKDGLWQSNGVTQTTASKMSFPLSEKQKWEPAHAPSKCQCLVPTTQKTLKRQRSRHKSLHSILPNSSSLQRLSFHAHLNFPFCSVVIESSKSLTSSPFRADLVDRDHEEIHEGENPLAIHF